ncbi:MAG TPA: glycosyltransferase family 4 protein [Pirellulales bacterium]|jgi:glycosyltransferase involved in cell wall biosynthesis|nr:glycosyltransferase family 4 protein [Pirellulales bacterium]
MTPGGSQATPCKIAYLVNEYPKTSHSFIRREIAALEAHGLTVVRISVRRATNLADDADRDEADRTRVLLDAGAAGLATATLRRMLRSPRTFVGALATAWRLGGRSDRGRLRHLAYLAEACLLAERAAADRFDHVHAHFGTNPPSVALLCRIVGGPTYSFTVHGPEEFDKPQAWSLGEKIAGATFVAAISEFTRSQLYRWCDHQHWNKIHVVRCGLDAMFLDTPPAPAVETNQLVCVGRLCEQKGQLLLVEAAGQLHREGWQFKLVLVGDGPMRGEIETLIRRLDLEEHIELVGWKSNAEVRDLLIASRAMVLASFAEGLPVGLMEALALHRPVISTYVAGIPELVEHGGSGWLVPAGSVAALTDALRSALAAPIEQLEAMGQRGATRVATNHRASHEAAKLVELFGKSPCGTDPRGLAAPQEAEIDRHLAGHV